MKRRIMLTLSTLALCSIALPIAALADDGAWSFPLAESKGKATQRIHGAIEKLVDDMNFIKRPFARSKLKDTNKICSSVSIKVAGADVSVQCGSDKVFTTPKDGSKKRVKGTTGDMYDLTQKVTGDTVIQTFHAEEGKRTARYIMDKDHKKLTMDVKVESDQLPYPLTYKVYYKMK